MPHNTKFYSARARHPLHQCVAVLTTRASDSFAYSFRGFLKASDTSASKTKPVHPCRTASLCHKSVAWPCTCAYACSIFTWRLCLESALQTTPRIFRMRQVHTVAGCHFPGAAKSDDAINLLRKRRRCTSLALRELVSNVYMPLLPSLPRKAC